MNTDIKKLPIFLGIQSVITSTTNTDTFKKRALLHHTQQAACGPQRQTHKGQFDVPVTVHRDKFL
jgi:hypothetical protein